MALYTLFHMSWHGDDDDDHHHHHHNHHCRHQSSKSFIIIHHSSSSFIIIIIITIIIITNMMTKKIRWSWWWWWWWRWWWWCHDDDNYVWKCGAMSGLDGTVKTKTGQNAMFQMRNSKDVRTRMIFLGTCDCFRYCLRWKCWSLQSLDWTLQAAQSKKTLTTVSNYHYYYNDKTTISIIL